MTSRTSDRDQPRRSAEQARQAVEALFQAPRSPPEKDVEVVVRRRRLASPDNVVHVSDTVQDVAEAVRAPRIFQVEKQEEHGGQPEGRILTSAAGPQARP